ncbi:hypothetical protein RA276_28310, partial [Pseudomonas syringae pv. tagetis]
WLWFCGFCWFGFWVVVGCVCGVVVLWGWCGLWLFWGFVGVLVCGVCGLGWLFGCLFWWVWCR